MNIQFQVSGIVIIVTVMILYIRRVSLKLNTQLMFCNVFCTLFVCLTFDILSIFAINGWLDMPDWMVIAICKIYLTTLVAVALAFFLYVYSDTVKNRKRMRKGVRLYALLAVIDVVCIFLMPISMYQDGNITYTNGPSVMVTYVGAAGFVFYNLFFIFRNRKILNPRRRNVMAIGLGVWGAAAVLQLVRPDLLVVGFAGSIGTLVVFLQMENPELFKDKATGFFNAGALKEYLEQQLECGEDFAVISVLVRYGIHKGITAKVSENIMLDLAKQLMALPQSKAFKVGDSEILIVFDKPENADAQAQEVREIFRSVLRQYEGRPSAEYILIPSSTMVSSAAKVAQIIQYIDSKGLALGNKGIFRVTDEMVERMEREFWVAALIKEAVRQKDRIEVFYQPIYDTKEGSFTSAEALVRMYDRDGNLIPPGDFIPIAEANGMILQIGEIVFEKVCHFFMEQDLPSHGIQYIEVNLSMVQCVQSDLADNYIGIMQKYNIKPSNLNLEITESASLAAKQILLRNMDALIDFGVSFSLDDFGTGQSNLNYIMEMPVRIVKFDKDMTGAYFENDRARYIMDTAIQMIHGMGLEIVSEGVETKEQYDALLEKGIDHIQGYYFSKPLRGEEFLRFLDAS